MKITTAAEEAYAGRLAVGMELGAHENGNLRVAVSLEDGSRVAIELPHAWLHEEGGVRHFIESECHRKLEVGHDE